MRGAIPARKTKGTGPNYLLILFGVMGVALLAFFYKSFLPHCVLFDNDGPLGEALAECNRMPDRFFGTWRNLWWVGLEAPAASPSLSMLLSCILSPVAELKFYAPLTLLLLAFSAWLYFRQLGFHPAVCVLGGLAAGLNMHFFSTACWGLAEWNIAAGMVFLALAALQTRHIAPLWAKATLAGLAAGMCVMEAFDVGAISTLFIGAFVLFRALSEENGAAKKFSTALVTELVVVGFALLIACQTVVSLFSTQIKNVSGQDESVVNLDEQWNYATTWSLPKVETLRLITPGIFGYQEDEYMSTEDKTSAYWGRVGSDPHIDGLRSSDAKVRAHTLELIQRYLALLPVEVKSMASDDPKKRDDAATSIILRGEMPLRQSGTGEYAGILIGLFALFALANSWRGEKSPFTAVEKRAVWFWGASALLCVLAAWGRFGFLYRLLYPLPFFSSIRNPIKFLHPFHILWIILAVYGLEVLPRRYFQARAQRSAPLLQHIKAWWLEAEKFEQRWVAGCAIALAAALVCWAVLFLSWDTRLAPYLEDQGFSQDLSAKMAVFSVGELAWFLGFFIASTVVMAGILSGAWNGPRVGRVWIYLGLILVLDLARADWPWVHYLDYEQKYNPSNVTDFLDDKAKPYEERVMGRLTVRGPGSSVAGLPGQLYEYWLQNNFPAHEIQALDLAQLPRIPQMDDAYMRALTPDITNWATADFRVASRLWELTGTRYLFLSTNYVDALANGGQMSALGLKVITSLRIEQKPLDHPAVDGGDLTVNPDTNGDMTILENTHVLPRAKLYSQWETPGSDQETLNKLAAPSFDPSQTVLVSSDSPAPKPTGALTNGDPGQVEITQYHPKEIQLHAVAKTSAILLLNERIAPDWSVRVDQQPAPLLRCNYIMRGVYLTPGEHQIEFHYEIPLGTLWLSIAGWVAGLAVAGYLLVSSKTKK